MEKRKPQQKYEPAADTIEAIQRIISIATPKATYRGKMERNRLVNAILPAVASMKHKKK